MADKSKDDGHGGGGHGHLDPAHLIGHVKDSEYFEGRKRSNLSYFILSNLERG